MSAINQKDTNWRVVGLVIGSIGLIASLQVGIGMSLMRDAARPLIDRAFEYHNRQPHYGAATQQQLRVVENRIEARLERIEAKIDRIGK